MAVLITARLSAEIPQPELTRNPRGPGREPRKMKAAFARAVHRYRPDVRIDWAAGANQYAKQAKATSAKTRSRVRASGAGQASEGGKYRPKHKASQRYRAALERSCRVLDEIARPDCQCVLQGSIATMKFLDPIVVVFGNRVLFPEEFIGRGDMSRGGLLLRCARARVPLSYAPLGNLTRHGSRPPRLPRIPRSLADADGPQRAINPGDDASNQKP